MLGVNFKMLHLQFFAYTFCLKRNFTKSSSTPKPVKSAIVVRSSPAMEGALTSQEKITPCHLEYLSLGLETKNP